MFAHLCVHLPICRLSRLSQYAVHAYGVPVFLSDGIEDLRDDKLSSYKKARFAHGVQELGETLSTILRYRKQLIVKNVVA